MVFAHPETQKAATPRMRLVLVDDAGCALQPVSRTGLPVDRVFVGTTRVRVKATSGELEVHPVS